MAYTTINFKTKKALKDAVDAYNRYMTLRQAGPLTIGALLASKEFDTPPKPVTVFQPGPFSPDVKDGTVTLEGPHYPEPHRWYASAVVKSGLVVKVK